MSSPTCGEWLVSKEVMKAKTLNFLCGLSLLSLGLWSCSETNYPVYPDCIEARVIDNVCGQAVIEILSSPYHHLGEDNFLASDGNTYNNVFSTTLDCEEIELIPQRGGTFYFKLTEDQGPQNCISCLALPSRMPEVWLEMEIVEDCLETNSSL